MRELKSNLMAIQSRISSGHKKRQLRKYVFHRPGYPLWKFVVYINMRLLGHLSEDVSKIGATLVVLDAITFHKGTNPYLEKVSGSVKAFAKYKGFGYIPIYKKFQESVKVGRSPIWKFDRHLNEHGNKVLANSIYNFLSENLSLEEPESIKKFLTH